MSSILQTQIKTGEYHSVTPSPTGSLQRKKEPDCQEKESRQKPVWLQRKPANYFGPYEVPPIVHEVLRSPGHPLDQQTRTFMEPRFGHDFSQVRVHTDNKAAESARSVDAKAYTVGQDVVFGAGQYASESQYGRHLLAHELTHVIQQRHLKNLPLQYSLSVGFQQDRFEQEADDFARSVTEGRTVNQIHSTLHQPRLQRASFGEIISKIPIIGPLVEFLSRTFGEGTFDDEELLLYLDYLAKHKNIEDNYDSDNKVREIVRRWDQGQSAYNVDTGYRSEAGVLSQLELKSLLIQEMMAGIITKADQNSILRILEKSSQSDVFLLFKLYGTSKYGISKDDLGKKMNTDNRKRLQGLLRRESLTLLSPGYSQSRPGITKGIIAETIDEDISRGMLGIFDIMFDERVNSVPAKFKNGREGRRIQGGLDGFIKFTPSKDSQVPDSTKIGLVQTARVVKKETGNPMDIREKYPHQNLPEEIMTAEDEKRGIASGFFVDIAYDKLRRGISRSKYYIDEPGFGAYTSKEKRIEDQHGFKQGNIVGPAVLTDKPGWFEESTFSFETYAQSDNPTMTYGGVKWGFKIERNLFPMSTVFPIGTNPVDFKPKIIPEEVVPMYTLSPTSEEAIRRFEKEIPKLTAPIQRKPSDTPPGRSSSVTPLRHGLLQRYSTDRNQPAAVPLEKVAPNAKSEIIGSQAARGVYGGLVK